MCNTSIKKLSRTFNCCHLIKCFYVRYALDCWTLWSQCITGGCGHLWYIGITSLSLTSYRSQVPHQVDSPWGRPVWPLHHQVRRLVLRHPADRACDQGQSAIPRWVDSGWCSLVIWAAWGGSWPFHMKVIKRLSRNVMFNDIWQVCN